MGAGRARPLGWGGSVAVRGKDSEAGSGEKEARAIEKQPILMC